MNKQQVVKAIVRKRISSPQEEGSAFAPVNIALCKYWGKRDEELNLPVTSSLSVSLGGYGATTRICPAERDRVVLNGTEVAAGEPFAERILDYLRLFSPGTCFEYDTQSTVPVGAGLASSASGFASAVLALDNLFGWGLERRDLSILARLGSGSACRSVYDGFVEWHAGSGADGMDSVAEPIDAVWPELRLGLLMLTDAEKPIGSRPAMKRTVETSALYKAWPGKVASDLVDLRAAIRDQDFDRLGRAAESNALAMHATMFAAVPPICYWIPESVAAMNGVWEARAEGLPLYLTMDAGPNVKLLFLEKDEKRVEGLFPEVKVIAPFS